MDQWPGDSGLSQWPKQPYEQLIPTAAEGLFGCAILAATSVVQTWPNDTEVQTPTEEQSWTLAFEFLWFFLAALTRELYIHPEGGDELRDRIQDDLVGTAIKYAVERATVGTVANRQQQAQLEEQLLQQYNEAEMEYGGITRIGPPRDDLGLEHNLAGKFAARAVRALGHRDHVGLMVEFSRIAMEMYIAVNIPRLTIASIEAASPGL